MEKTNASKQGVLHWLDENFEKMFLVTGLLSITLFITWQVIYRYIITQFIERAGAAVWTEELSRYIFIWISYLALSVAIKKRSSIRVDMLYDHLPPRLQQISWIVVEVLFFILTATIAYYGWGQIERLQEYPQHTTALRIPFLIPYLILPFGFGLMCFRLLQSLYKQVKVCGLVDTLIGLIAVFVIASPVIFCDYIEPLPALFGYFIVLCAIGVPVAISLGLSTLATIICADTLPIEYMAQVAFTSIDSFPIMAIPFFIAAGVFMGAGGLSHRLLSLADEIVGGTYGGIGLTAIVTCMFFGAISGSGPATVAAIGAIMMPALTRANYPKSTSAGMIAAGGALGPIIPPSANMVVYGAAMGLSVSKMFIGGVLPGIMMAVALCLVNVYLAAKYKFAKSDVRYPKKEVLRRTARAIPTLVLPVIILGGIYGGYVTPTEAAVLSVLYALIYGFATKEIKVKVLWTVLSKTVLTSAVVTFIISVAKTFGWILSKTRLPAIIGEAIMEVIPNKWVYLAVLMALLFLVGCLMDTIPSILILAPILVPVGVQFGLDELHLGVLFCITLTVGFITPPFGINLFTAVSTTGESYTSVVKGVIPFMIVMIICVLICAFVSPIITFLPGFMMGT